VDIDAAIGSGDRLGGEARVGLSARVGWINLPKKKSNSPL